MRLEFLNHVRGKCNDDDDSRFLKERPEGSDEDDSLMLKKEPLV